jgi:hypothetical protein
MVRWMSRGSRRFAGEEEAGLAGGWVAVPWGYGRTAPTQPNHADLLRGRPVVCLPRLGTGS